jgi:uncharacterized repeat protein (TIGR03806 family)
MKRVLVAILSSALTLACDGNVDSGAAAVNNNNDNSNNTNGNTNGNANNNNNNNNSNDNVTPAPLGYETRPTNATCTTSEQPAPPGGLALEAAEFGELTDLGVLTDLKRAAVDLAGTQQWFGIRQSGELITWPDGQSGGVAVLIDSGDLTSFQVGGERGLLGLALDPAYPNSNAPTTVRAYINYTNTCASDLCTRLARFDFELDADGVTLLNTPSEERIFETRQPAGNHNGGALAFDSAGLLYMSTGDGGSGDDPWCNGQNLSTPLGAILRFDVHSTSTGYTIPSGNPFSAASSTCDSFTPSYSQGQPQLARSEPCPEIYAFGLRNPFRMSMDLSTGSLWIGDVGQNAVEETSVIDVSVDNPRYNLGWPLREGDIAGASITACDTLETQRGPFDTIFVEPALVMHHAGTSRSSVVGGYVYRGSALGAGYFGRYFCGDYGSSEVWALADPYAGGTRDVDDDLDADERLGDISRHIGWAEDEAGELVMLTLSGPRRLAPASPTSDAFPRRLSEVGCFDPMDPREVVAGVIPYEMQAPLWSDGAEKRRYFAIPDGSTIDRLGNCEGLSTEECAEQADWDFPVGTVLIKSFILDGIFVETRLYMHHDDGEWGGYSYRWNDEQSDAFLLDGSQVRQVGDQTWTFPGRGDCAKCHTPAAGVTLGPETRQLAGDAVYPGALLAPQLATLDHIGILSPPLDGSEPAGFSVPGSDDDLEAEARAYLHSNCSMCHRPGGGVGGSVMDLRYTTPLSEAGACGVAPVTRAWPGLSAPALIKAGDAANSVISVRMHAAPGAQRMPPLASDLVDATGVGVIDAWINALSACP